MKIPVYIFLIFIGFSSFMYWLLAQTAEQSPVKESVSGSSPEESARKDHSEWYKKAHKGTLKHLVKLRADPAQRAKFGFFAYGPMHQLFKWESGNEDSLNPWKPKGKHFCQVYYDTGEILTCFGITFKYHPDWYLDVLSRYGGFNFCVRTIEPLDLKCDGRSLVNERKFYADKMKQILSSDPPGFSWRRRISDFYWDHYGRQYFLGCGFTAASYLFDIGMLSGHRRTIKLLQKSHGLNVDGLFGPRTREKCQEGEFNKEAFLKAEIARFKSLKRCQKYCRGWIRRAKDKDWWASRSAERFKGTLDAIKESCLKPGKIKFGHDFLVCQ